MKTFSFSFSVLIACVLFSCHKSSNSNPFGNVRIASADVSHAGAIEHYRFFYDTYSNLDSVSITGDGTAAGHTGYLKYHYIGSSWNISDENGNSFEVYASTTGLLLKILVPDTLSFIYQNGILSKINEYTPSPLPPYYVSNPAYYTWKGGDVTTVKTNTLTQTYSYAEDKNGQPGDAIRIDFFLKYGAAAFKTAHLPASLVTDSTQGENYAYTFDAKGRISTLAKVVFDKTLSAHDTTFYAYTYY